MKRKKPGVRVPATRKGLYVINSSLRLTAKNVNVPYDQRTMNTPDLKDSHYQHLKSSSILDEVIIERGYMTVTRKQQLTDCGFSKNQNRVGGILIPLWSVNGDVYSYQYRPDTPRSNDSGKIIKYENPPKISVRIDVPPRCQPKLGDPGEPLFITEGVKKVDSLASRGVCAIALTGVWNFKGTNALGGNTLLADWDYIALKERICYIVFDSDVTTKPQVKKAMDRLSEHLFRKGAKVRILQLPDGPEGQKLGADDYFADGHSVEELIALEVQDKKSVEEAAKFVNDTQYRIENGVICWEHYGKEGKTLTALCNFNAHISSYVIKDNGQDQDNYFRINGTTWRGKPLPAVDVKTEDFQSMKWVLKHWGLEAIVNPGQNIKDRLAHAILCHSVDTAANKQVFTHLGWREVDGRMVYLSGGGGIGPEGHVDVGTEMEEPLKGYILLRPDGDRAEAYSISNNFLLIGKMDVTLPLWTAMYLAPLSSYIDTSFALWYIAGSGSFKSVLSALALSHYGTFDHLSLPAGWDATKNDLEKLLFLAKDAPLIIDDLYPGEDASETRNLFNTAGKIIRAQGNRQARGRMRADRSLESGYRPRGLLISSGEHAPGGHSQNSRILIVNMNKDDIYRDALTEAQKNTLYYNRSMSHYIQWLAQNWQSLKDEYRALWEKQRDKFYSERTHARLAGDIASMYVGLYSATKFGVEIGAMPQKEAETLRDYGAEIFSKIVDEQAQTVEELRPGKRFVSVMSTLITMGRVSLTNLDSLSAPHSEPAVPNVGWMDSKGTYYFDPDVAYQAVYEFCQRSGQPFTVKPDAVWRDLKIQNISKDNEEGRAKAQQRIPGLGRRERVIKIPGDYIGN